MKWVGCDDRKKTTASRKRTVTSTRARTNTFTRKGRLQDTISKVKKRPFKFRG